MTRKMIRVSYPGNEKVDDRMNDIRDVLFDNNLSIKDYTSDFSEEITMLKYNLEENSRVPTLDELEKMFPKPNKLEFEIMDYQK